MFLLLIGGMFSPFSLEAPLTCIPNRRLIRIRRRLVPAHLVGLLVVRSGLLILTTGLITGYLVLRSRLIGNSTGRAGCPAGRHLSEANSAQRNSDG